MNPTQLLGVMGSAGAPANGTVNQYVAILQGIVNIGPAPNNDTWGHYLFGWDDATLANQQISLGQFVAIAGGNVPNPPIDTAPPVTSSQQATQQAGTSTATNNTNGTTTTNVVAPVTGSSDLIFGGIDFSTTYFGVPLWIILGGAVGVAVLTMQVHKGRR